MHGTYNPRKPLMVVLSTNEDGETATFIFEGALSDEENEIEPLLRRVLAADLIDVLAVDLNDELDRAALANEVNGATYDASDLELTWTSSDGGQSLTLEYSHDYIRVPITDPRWTY